MKKVILLTLASFGLMTAQAQNAYTNPGFDDNWSVGLDGGATTIKSDFLKNIRGAAGLHIQKQISPLFALGVEGIWGVNTSSWHNERSSTAFDNSYVGIYGAFSLFNLFTGDKCGSRPFDIEAVAGVGWGHDYANDGPNENGDKDFNYYAGRAGLNFNFNLSKYITLSLKPYVLYNKARTNYATFNLLASVSYHFGGRGFECVVPQNADEIAALNTRINELRSAIDATNAANAAAIARSNALASELAACESSKKNVTHAVADNAGTVRYVMYGFSSSKIPASQIPNIEMTANYLKQTPKARVIIDGYASPEGNLQFNQRLAAARAESVKKMLVKKYGISADRITAQGKGISDSFEKNSWNRVAICTVED